MHAAPVGAKKKTKQTEQSDTIPQQAAKTDLAAGIQSAMVQNRQVSSDPRGPMGMPPQSAIDPAESSAPSMKVVRTGDAINPQAQAILHFHQRVEAGAFSEVETLLCQLPALSNAMDVQTGLTPLCRAAINGHTGIARLLLSAGAQVDGRERHGSTALMFAAQAGYVEMIRLLCKCGANINAVNQHMSQSVLAGAVNEKQFDACKVLIEAGADIHSTMTAASGAGHTASPLDVTIVQGWTKLLQWLLSTKRLSVDSEIVKGTSLLNFACFTGSLESVRFLLGAGANATARYDLVTDTLQGPLWYADVNAQYHVVEYLLNRGISVPSYLPALSFPGSECGFNPGKGPASDAEQIDNMHLAMPVGVTDPLLLQSPQKIIEDLANKKIDLLPNEKIWTQWLTRLGICAAISHEIFERIRNTAIVFRALAGKHAGTSKEQYLQALAVIVSEACASPNLNAPFSNFKMTPRGQKVMSQLVHSQRTLLLQGVASLHEQQRQRLKTLPDVCFNTYISTSHQLDETGLHLLLTREWGLYEPVALATVRVIKAAHEQVLRSPLDVPLRTALTSLLDGLSESSYLPEFAAALDDLAAHGDKKMFGELIFAQWRMLNDAYQVTIKRPPLIDAAQ